jgi:hypothetical protein
MGCTCTRDSKFYKTLELYLHMNTMVVQGILPKGNDYRQFKQRLEALEGHNHMFIMMVSSLVKKNEISFQVSREGRQPHGTPMDVGHTAITFTHASQVPLFHV